MPLDTERFVQNVEYWCKLKGEPPTIACEKSGAGRSLIANIKRGSFPSVAKVLDERYAPFIDLFAELDPAEQTKVVGDMLRRKNKK